MEEKMQKNIRVKQYSLTAITVAIFAIVGSVSAYAETASAVVESNQASASTVAPATSAKRLSPKSTKSTRLAKSTRSVKLTKTVKSVAKSTQISVQPAVLPVIVDDTFPGLSAKADSAIADQIVATSAVAPTIAPEPLPAPSVEISSNISIAPATPSVESVAPPADSLISIVPSNPPAPAAEPAISAASVVPAAASAETTTSVKPQEESAPSSAEPTPSMVPAASDAGSALKQKSSDVTAAKSLDETFTASERQYSLSKQGSYSLIYDFGYSYYANTVLDLALDTNSSSITRLRVENNAQHAIANNFSVQYGLRNNLTLTASLPIIAKINPPTSTQTAGLGDLNLGVRWEPFALGTTALPVTLFGSMTAPTGDSPYEINPQTDLSTGQGYYSFSGGASTRKFIDPIVLFGTLSANYGLTESGLNQKYGTTTLVEFFPGYTVGIGFGFAYSLNYDVSLTVSYQQSFVFGSEYRFFDGVNSSVSSPGNASAATLSSSLGIRVSPKTIVNVSLGFGLTPGSPNVSLGMSLPLDFLGLGRVVK